MTHSLLVKNLTLIFPVFYEINEPNLQIILLFKMSGLK